MKCKPLKDVAQIIMGQSPDSSSYNEVGEGLPFFQGNADFGVMYPSERIWCNQPKKIANENDILISVRAPIGALNYANKKCCIGRGLAAITVNNPVERNYIFHLLKAKNAELNRKGTGSTFKAIGKNVLEDIPVPIVSSEIQLHITRLMDITESIISKRKNELKYYDELIKARFVEMFGDPATNPKYWLVASLGEYITVLTDFSSNGSYELLDSNVTMFDEPNYAVMVRTTDLENRNLQNYEGVKYINQKAYELLSKSKLFGGELIMNKIGSAGKIYLMPFISKPASLGRNAFMLRFDERINMTFLYTLLSSDYGTSEIQHYVRGAVTKTITKNDVKKVRIFVPPIELQNEFSNLVVQVDKSKAEVQKSLEQTKLLFDSLMQHYFS